MRYNYYRIFVGFYSEEVKGVASRTMPASLGFAQAALVRAQRAEDKRF
jgi:hypothetical protein